jgi:OmcA/MtrC family decaheme c-type cytochrome
VTKSERRASSVPALLGAAAAFGFALSAGCKQPLVGEPTKAAQEVGGPEVTITGATVTGTGRVLVHLTVSQGGLALTRDAALALLPTFTLAVLAPHPVDGIPAWKSLVATGPQVSETLPPGGPGTPPGQILANVRQPGGESDGTSGGADGAWTYLFASPLPGGFLPSQTLRVGVYLAAAQGTSRTSDTHDFRPDGAKAAPRDTVLDANCDRCHGSVRAHGGTRVGVRLCVTCHTWQNADPDTVDPAAMAGATPLTDPNPLELGRLVHRIHRGRNLPTLYRSSSTAAAPPLGSGAALPLPFFPGRNAPQAGAKYSVVGYQSREVVFGQIRTRMTSGQTAAKLVAEGVVHPRDLRDCDACHAGAPQEYEVLFGISRRTCQGCHTDTWFEASSISDEVHFAHPGGPQGDDSECVGCHVVKTATQPKVYAPLVEIHVPPRKSPHFRGPAVEFRSVQNLKPGAAPTVVFRLRDHDGQPLAPSAFSYMYGNFAQLVIAGPTSPDYGVQPPSPITSFLPGNPNLFAHAPDPATGDVSYTFSTTLPADASGTWIVTLEGYRQRNAPHYDPASDTFRWPYTGETIRESFPNVLVHVDTATGAWTPSSPGATVPRRRIVSQEKCLACHGELALHGTLRQEVPYCVACHTPAATDWVQRPMAGGRVDLGATYDGIEERSIDFKVMIHRIHTGGRIGAAALDLLRPHVVYGYGGKPYFYDDAIFPRDLADCTLCHEGKTYTVDSVPAAASPTVANESPTIFHLGAGPHAAGEPTTPPIQAACMGCHATGAARSHATRHTAGAVEQCANCHVRGSYSVDVVHGLAPAGAAPASASYRSIAEEIIVPRCASAACHGGNPPAAFPQLDADAGWAEMVGQPSQQVSAMLMVKPYAPDESYLVLKLRNDAGRVGGIATPMPIGDAVLEPADIATIEAWIANGAPND